MRSSSGGLPKSGENPHGTTASSATTLPFPRRDTSSLRGKCRASSPSYCYSFELATQSCRNTYIELNERTPRFAPAATEKMKRFCITSCTAPPTPTPVTSSSDSVDAMRASSRSSSLERSFYRSSSSSLRDLVASAPFSASSPPSTRWTDPPHANVSRRR